VGRREYTFYGAHVQRLLRLLLRRLLLWRLLRRLLVQLLE
jgi:hypothetical protein